MNRLKSAWSTIRENSAVIVLTFEVFWIVIFLLNRVAAPSADGVPQFVYVNF